MLGKRVAMQQEGGVGARAYSQCRVGRLCCSGARQAGSWSLLMEELQIANGLFHLALQHLYLFLKKNPVLLTLMLQRTLSKLSL